MYTELMQYVPFKKCDFTEEPSSYLHSAEADVLQPPSDTFNYTCWSGFNATENAVPKERDQACTSDLDTTPRGVRACPGEPYHDEFFEKTTYHTRNDF